MVYLARDDELDRPVAIKVLAGHLADDPVFRDRFVREARLAAGLSHPNIVQIYDAGEDDGNPYIVMEYVDGRSLADELDLDGPLDPARVVDLGVQVCAGLEHAHAAGLVHRDIPSETDVATLVHLGHAAITKRVAELVAVREQSRCGHRSFVSILVGCAPLAPMMPVMRR